MKKNFAIGIMATILLLNTPTFVFANEAEDTLPNNNSSITQQIETEVSKAEIPFNPDIAPAKPYLGPEEESSLSARSIVGFVTKVTGISSGSYLTVRAKPDTSAAPVGSLKNGAEVTMSLYRQGKNDGHWWRYIEAEDSKGNIITGYVAETYLASNVHLHPAGSPFAGECTRNDCY